MLPPTLLGQLQEAFPDCAVSKEGSALDHLVVVLLDGCEVWRADTRLVPILAPDTTNQALSAVRAAAAAAAAAACQYTPADEQQASVEEIADSSSADAALDAGSTTEPIWIGKLDCWGFG